MKVNDYIIQYDPKEAEKDINCVYDTTEYDNFVKIINDSDIKDPDFKKFLLLAATRFIKFNYGKIADRYCVETKENQNLMEKLGLVILDIDNLLQNGFLRLNKNLEKNCRGTKP